jgi:Tol biopolymer transport system component
MITPGTRLGAYEVVSSLGAGGMGEVYKAQDTRLGRLVALKILPATFRGDPERLARFQREAQLLAALNHPRIGAIYGIEEAADVQFLVLELVDGETLATRIERGRLGTDESLRIAREVIDALEAAHDKGIIHRDLKPSNIALTADGHVKVLDFGLAKATDPTGLSELSPHGVTHSPTLTLAATQVGVILGTAAYMSPEQAKGRAADKRSDVWAFGCVLFEMLTGTRAFDGEDVSDTMAAVLRGEPRWDALPSDLPPSIATLLKKCLDKDRRSRIPDLSVVRYLMDDAAHASAPAPTAPAAVSTPRALRLLPWGLAAAAIAIAVLVVSLWQPWRAPATAPLTRVRIDLGTEASLSTQLGAAADLSPDGQVVVFVAGTTAARQQLFVRRLDQLQATALAGTEGATTPFFSPDGQWIGFFAGSKLKKIAVSGGAAVTLADAPTPRGGTWDADDSIVFAPQSTGGLLRVSSAGGMTSPATQPPADRLHRWPSALPGGRVLYTTSVGGTFSVETAALEIRDPDGKSRVLVPGGYYGRYVRSGHILYISNGTMFAVPFDAASGQLTGQGVPVVEAVAGNDGNGTAHFAVSANGTAVYLPGETINNDTAISWVDQTGAFAPLRAMASNWSNPEFSPDGRRIAVDISDGSQSDVWVYEWDRDTLSRLTFETADDQRPIWSPDGRRIAFASRRGDKTTFNLYWQRSDGTGDVQRLTDTKNQQMTASFHPNGQLIAFDEVSANGARDIMILPLEGDEATGWKPGTPYVFLQTPQNEGSPMFSPDGHWILYISNETGRNELYVRPFPGPGGKWQISNGSADDPTWSRDGRRVFFASVADTRIMTAPYRVDGGSFRADKPATWSPAQFLSRPRPPSRDFALHPDGRRFAVAAVVEAESQRALNQLVLVFNFFDELRRVAKPAK